MAKQTFVCDFGNGITCSTIVNFTRLFQGKVPFVDFTWSGLPKPNSFDFFKQAILPTYREWIHSINVIGANKTGKSILHCLQVDRDKWEMRAYKPNAQPELVSTEER